MPSKRSPQQALKNPAPRMNQFWVWLSIWTAMLAVLGNVVALGVPAVYAALKPGFYAQAVAQDVASLAVIAPLWIVAAILALRGSLRAYLLWLGVLTFTVYNYVIYTFAIPFGPLFLLWVAVLGLTLFSLIGGALTVDHAAVRAAFKHPTAVRVAAWALIVVGVLFALLWLSEDVPALLAGQAPASLAEMGITTNPVHILDLAFFLPAAILIGIWLLRARPFAFTFAPGFVLFLILTGVPILLTPVLQASRGEVTSWGVMLPIGTLTVLLLATLLWLLSTLKPQSRT